MGKVRIGLLGGSFNPVHNGHLAIARGMIERDVISKVLLLVTPQNPLKLASTLAPESVRLKLARLACQDEANIEASDFEFSLPKPSYTWQTLTAMTSARPDWDITLLMGADNWRIFPQWYRYQDIIRQYKIAIYPRESVTIDTCNLPEHVKFINLPLINVSSTEIRRKISRGENISALVPPRVCEEIKRSGIYK